MTFVAGYELKPGETIRLKFTPEDQCPQNDLYIIRTLETLEVRDPQGNLVRDLLKKDDGSEEN